MIPLALLYTQKHRNSSAVYVPFTNLSVIHALSIAYDDRLITGRKRSCSNYGFDLEGVKKAVM